MKKRFLSLFPASFADASYQAVEREYKIAAHELAKKLLQNMRFEEARQSGDCDAIWRDAYKILQATNLVFPNELIKFRAGVNSRAGRRQFVARLQTLLFGQAAELQYRFTSFCDFLLDIGAPKWTLATYFPFIMFPDQFMFMKPLITIAAAELCDFELNYKPQLNWLTYKSLLDFAAMLKELLKDLEPRDYIDVQSFIWCTRMK